MSSSESGARSLINRLQDFFQALLNNPARVLWLCCIVGVASLVLDGSALRLWSLKRDRTELERRIVAAETRSKQLEFQIHQAGQPEFIERQARDQFDLVKEGDLVFAFAEDAAESPDLAK